MKCNLQNLLLRRSISVRLSARARENQTPELQHILCMLPVARSSSDGAAIRYVFPVLCTTSRGVARIFGLGADGTMSGGA